MPEFPSEEWLAEYVDRINASAAYREAAATWQGDVAYVLEAEPDKGLDEDVWAWLDLWHGECRDGKVVSSEEGEKARFVIRSPYSRWKDHPGPARPDQGDDDRQAEGQGRSPDDRRPPDG